MRVYYSPARRRGYYNTDYLGYLCGRVHATSGGPDGKVHRFFISESAETDGHPWAIPILVEERELLNQEVMENWLDSCKHPEDQDLRDASRHFGYRAPGGKHLTRDQVVERYREFGLKPVELEGAG